MKAKSFKRIVLISSLIALSLPLFGRSSDSEIVVDNENKASIAYVFGENAIQVSSNLSKDEMVKNAVCKLTITVLKNCKINSVKANDTELHFAFGTYSFKLRAGENNVVIISSLDGELKELSATQLNIANTSNYYKLWKNSGFPHFNSLGNQKLLVIPVTIKGYKTRATNENKAIIEKAFFGSSSDTNYESLASYYEKSSYGKLNLSGEVTDWFDLNMTPEEIGKASYKSDSVSTDYGTYTVLEKALNWVKEATTIDLTDYDNDKDGFDDGVYLVYSAPDYTEDYALAKLAAAGTAYFWNFTFYNVKNKDGANFTSPTGMTYSWGSLSSIFKGYGITELIPILLFMNLAIN